MKVGILSIFNDRRDKEEKFVAQLKKHEGLRLYPYKCTSNKTTIGYGRNIEDRGISEPEAEYLLKNDIEECKKKLKEMLPWTENLDDVRRWALINMAFNMGIGGLLSFRVTLRAINVGEYEKAYDGILRSKYAKQVGYRAEEIAEMILTGKLRETL